MKKLLLVGIAATAILVSCSNDETVGTPEQNAAIGFSSFVDKSTRAIVQGTTMQDDFKVWGFRGDVNQFENVGAVAANGIYSNTQYWTLGYKYNFVAIAPYTEGVKAENVNCTDGEVSGILNFTNENNVTDLLYVSTNEDATTAIPTGKVNLIFDHMLSKVMFTFVNNFSSDEYSFYVENVKIKNVESQATLTIPAKTWSDFTEKQEVEFRGAASQDEQIVQNGNESTKELLIIPKTNVNYQVTFDLYVYQNDILVNPNGAAYEHTSTISYSFEMGKSYNFKATINQGNYNPDPSVETDKPIEFTTEVKGWDDNTEDLSIDDDSTEE